jgi:polyhydroxyalkanoate synthesis regulator phasin
MVKYYFQSMNGSINFVCAGTKKDLEEKVKKEFGEDKAAVEAKIKSQIEDAEKKLDELQRVDCVTEKDRLENDIKVATLKKGIYDAKEELKRVGNLMKADLVFFELTPVEFDI